MLSARTVREKYPAHVVVEVRKLAREIARADQRVLEIRNLVVNSSKLTVAQVDLLLRRIDLLTPELADPKQRAILDKIRDGLVKARNVLGNASADIRILRDNYYTDADRMIEEYQAAILELAQFVSVEQLEALVNLSPVDRNAIEKKLTNADVVIPDSAVSGRGKFLRSAFGLPDLTR